MGVFAETDLIHEINHVGKYFRVQGPLNLPRTPQGRLVYVQAGSSEDGRDFGARHAEAVFIAHQTLDSAQAFYHDIKSRALAAGRDPRFLKVLPGISPYIGSTAAEAKALQEELNDLTQASYWPGQLQRLIGLDLTGHDLDAPFPRHLLDTGGEGGVASRFQLLLDIINHENPTLRQLVHRLVGARGHWVMTGTPDQIADAMEIRFEQCAADDFNVMPPWLPGGFEMFTEQVVPILRKRGMFRHDYARTTLRDPIGCPARTTLCGARNV
ncbi:NtaA/DmoA family FMN-dependent monooxygenase [Falsirhodobacter sp. 1013]|uniref:NtaA/DmoA family FMN-dependent monooxygenase n=1 Tax=Falsirhodobacter sp. 1013 TaxID=3417566 RepID=UPI003EBF21BA